VEQKNGSKVPPTIGIIMGSDSDWKTMRSAAEVLDEFGVPYEKRVVSAHRTPDYLFEYAGEAENRGLSLIIAGAGGAAHLPGMTAAKTILPVVGVPVNATPLSGLDALLSILQMPSEVGVATVGVGAKGAKDAALFAVAALSTKDLVLRTKLRASHEGSGPPGASSKVVILAGDDSDFEVLRHAEDYLSRLSIAYEKTILGNQIAPGGMLRRLADLEANGAAVFIAGSSGGIGLACEVAKVTTLPVLGVPILTGSVGSVDDFLRPFLDMPPGVAMFAIGKPGAINAALFAATIISEHTSEVWKKLQQMRTDAVARVRAMKID
jgi:5-(carboxyamino)imidazole ribonucleotide mutase